MPRTNRIIVKFAPIPDDLAVTIEQLVEEIRLSLPRGELVRGPGRSGYVVFLVDPAADDARLVADLSKRDYKAYAEPDDVDREA